MIEKAFREIETMNLSELEFNDYESAQKAEWDHLNKIETAKKEGIKEGIKEGKKEGREELLKKLLAAGLITPEQLKNI